MLETAGQKPFLKWAGGKQWLVPQIQSFLPTEFERYIEPFVGGASVFFAVRPARAFLSDSNAELVATYKAVARQPEDVVAALRRLKYEEREFYRIREARPRTTHGAAARFIYLNRSAWNGLYRVNKAGEFNVPFGKFSEPLGPLAGRIVSAAPLLRRASIRCVDFETALTKVASGDFVYLDPPYVSTHKENGFLRYNAKVFSWSDQRRLRDLVFELADRGAWVLVSNADHRSIENLYRGMQIRRLTRLSLVAGEVKRRTTVTELVISNYGKRAR